MTIERSVEKNRQLRPFRVAGWLVGCSAFQTGDFTFNSGLKAPIKVDTDALQFPEFDVVQLGIGEKLNDLLRERGVKPDVAVGVIAGGKYFAHLLSYCSPHIGAAARLGNTDTPDKREMIEGEIKSGDKVVIVEDVVTTGGNILAAKQQIEKEGGKVVMAVSVFDYGFEKARENFATANLPHASLTTLAHLIQVLEWTKHESLVLRLDTWRKQDVPAFFTSQTTP